MVGRDAAGVPLVGPANETIVGGGGARRPQRLHLSLATRTAFAARSARTSGAAIRATPTCRRAGPGSCRGRCGRSASTPKRLPRTWSPRRASIACCAEAANTASPCRWRRRSPSRRRAPRPACTSSASAPTSRASSSSCRTPGRWGSTSTACRTRAIRSSARACRRPTAPRPTASRCRAATAPIERIAGLPQFVTVLGGAYFFLPGIRALRFLATS